MVVYYISNFTITDPAKFEEYAVLTRQTFGPIIKAGNGKVLVNNSAEVRGVKEGTPLNTVLVVEFASREIAENWYNSEAYKPLIDMRQEATTKDSWVIITDQFTPPSQ